MVINYNDLIRNQISECFRDRDDLISENIFDFFCGLPKEGQKTVLKVALADLYKITYYIERKVSDLFKLPIEEIIDRCIDDISLAIGILEASNIFNKMDYVSKSLLLEIIQENDLDSELYSICKLHVLDKFTYVIVDDIDKYKEYYKEYIENNKDNPDCRKTIVEYICYRMLNLKFENETKYKKYMLELIKDYYKWKTFLIAHDSKEFLDFYDNIYLDIINSKSLEDIILYIEDEFDFLVTIVEEYLHIKTGDNKIHEIAVDNYFKSTADEKIKEKLKIKEN